MKLVHTTPIRNSSGLYSIILNIVERVDTFQPDFRIPVRFRTDLIDFRRSGYDWVHLVPSANQRDIKVLNSETFLLSNMSPQSGGLNRYKWRELEEEVRKLNAKEDVFETYVVTNLLLTYHSRQHLFFVQNNDKKIYKEECTNVDVKIPVPHKYFKSITVENNRVSTLCGVSSWRTIKKQVH